MVFAATRRGQAPGPPILRIGSPAVTQVNTPFNCVFLLPFYVAFNAVFLVFLPRVCHALGASPQTPLPARLPAVEPLFLTPFFESAAGRPNANVLVRVFGQYAASHSISRATRARTRARGPIFMCSKHVSFLGVTCGDPGKYPI